MSRDTNFYYSFVALPPSKRTAVIAVWDFCRAVDDVADERGVGKVGSRGGDEADPARELERWRGELDRCFNGGAPETPQGRRLLPWIRRFNLPRQAFEDLIDGVEMDLRQTRYPSFDALHRYCLRVASAVGLICVEIFGYGHPQTRSYGSDLGVALQLTNIIRDVASDLRRDRIYLPLDDLSRYGCTEQDLRAGVVTEKVRALLQYQCDRARSFYEKARAELPPQDARRLVAARIMAAIYLEILDAIERSGYDVFARPIRVARPRRAVIAALVWTKTMIGRVEA